MNKTELRGKLNQILIHIPVSVIGKVKNSHIFVYPTDLMSKLIDEPRLSNYHVGPWTFPYTSPIC